MTGQGWKLTASSPGLPAARPRRPPRRGTTDSRRSITHPPPPPPPPLSPASASGSPRAEGKSRPDRRARGAAIPPSAEGGKRLQPWVTSTRRRGRASARGSWRSTSGSPSASWAASRRSAGRWAALREGTRLPRSSACGAWRRPCGSSRRPGSRAGGARGLREELAEAAKAVPLPGAFGADRPFLDLDVLL